jgi:hypothetical protein
MQNRLRGPTGTFAVVAACALASVAVPAASAHQRHHLTKVSGTWSNPLGACVAHLTRFDPATGDFNCTGTSDWTGSWTGSTTWTVTGNQDLVTGASSGRIDEVFTGRAAHSRRGTLTFVERFTLDAAGNIHIHGPIVGSSRGLVGSRGHAEWVGTSSATDGSGSGTYSGRWNQGGRRHGRHH